MKKKNTKKKPQLCLPPPEKKFESIEEKMYSGSIDIFKEDTPLLIRCLKQGIAGCEKLISEIKKAWPDGQEKSQAIMVHSRKRQEYIDRLESVDKG